MFHISCHLLTLPRVQDWTISKFLIQETGDTSENFANIVWCCQHTGHCFQNVGQCCQHLWQCCRHVWQCCSRVTVLLTCVVVLLTYAKVLACTTVLVTCVTVPSTCANVLLASSTRHFIGPLANSDVLVIVSSFHLNGHRPLVVRPITKSISPFRNCWVNKTNNLERERERGPTRHRFSWPRRPKPARWSKTHPSSSQDMLIRNPLARIFTKSVKTCAGLNLKPNNFEFFVYWSVYQSINLYILRVWQSASDIS